ncbi:MAG TPA: DUF2975 domain-containing protein [Allosphingosinicella sp.]|jgi:hypothetical protein
MLLRIFRVLNLLTAALVVGALAATFVFEPQVRDFFTRQPARSDSALLMPILRVWLLVAPVAIAAVHVSLTRLLEMVETVRSGDPFVPENAARLKTIAWCVLALQLFHLLSGGMAAAMNAAGSKIDWSLSLTGWLAVALLFVLAQVFEQGTRIRDDLDAMV